MTKKKKKRTKEQHYYILSQTGCESTNITMANFLETGINIQAVKQNKKKRKMKNDD